MTEIAAILRFQKATIHHKNGSFYLHYGPAGNAWRDRVLPMSSKY